MNLKKDKFVDLPLDGGVRFVGVAEYEKKGESSLLILTGRQGYLIGEDKQVQRQFSAKSGLRPAAAVGGESFYVMETGGGYSDLMLFDSSGKPIWVSSPDKGANEMIGGDYNGDGVFKLYVAGRDGVRCLGVDRKEEWRFGSGLFFGVCMVSSKEGENVLVTNHRNRKKNELFYLLDPKTGRVVDSFESPFDTLSQIRSCDWSNEGKILTCDRDRLCLLDLKGQITFEYKATALIYDISNATVDFGTGESYLAVLLKFDSQTRYTKLLLFSATGDVVYEEVLPLTAGIATLKAGVFGNTNGLLVGAADKGVWLYTNDRTKK